MSRFVLLVMVVGVLFSVFVGYQYGIDRDADNGAVTEAGSFEALVPTEPTNVSGRDDDPTRMKDQAEFQRFVVLGKALTSMPASLDGTDVDGELAADAQGNLVITVGVRRVFDYFLSVIFFTDNSLNKAIMIISTKK